MQATQIARARITVDGEKAVLSHIRVRLNTGTEYDELAMKYSDESDWTILDTQMDADRAATVFELLRSRPIVSSDYLD